MDFQVLFNVALSVVMMLSGWMIRSVYDAINKLRQDQIQLERTIYAEYAKYVSKDDYREDLREIKSMLSSIFNKLEGKEDKQ